MSVTPSTPTLFGERDIDSNQPWDDVALEGNGKSPYTDTEFTILGIGPSKTQYSIHRSKLSQSPVLHAKSTQKLWGNKLNDVVLLPELDDSTAHTLVDFLYSGTYDTHVSHEILDPSALGKYKRGTCVYCAAIRYKLPVLAELAKERITSIGEDLTIMDVLRVARENAFPLLPDDETWFPAYLEESIKSAMAENPGFFESPEFSDQIEGNSRFKHVVMTAVFKALRIGFGSLSPLSSLGPTASAMTEDRIKPPATDDLQDMQELPVVEEKVEVEAADELPTVILKVAQVADHAAPIDKPTAEIDLANGSVKLDEIEPTIEAPKAPEPFTDELGFGNSKTFKQMGKPKEATPLESPATTDKAVSRPAHARKDSAMQSQESAPAPKVEEKTTVTMESPATTPAAEASSPVIVNGSTSTEGLSKNQLKKLRQKQKREAALAT